MNYKNTIVSQIQKSIDVKKELLQNEQLIKSIDRAAEVITEIYKRGNKTLLAGNGGSAADAQHIAGEFVSKFYFDRPGLASIALTTDTSVLTAIGNDYGYGKLFERQLQALGVEGDVFIGISTSGNSENVINALKICKERGIFAISFTGLGGGKMKEISDICIEVLSNETPRIQECHILIGHIICCIVEENLFSTIRKI